MGTFLLELVKPLRWRWVLSAGCGLVGALAKTAVIVVAAQGVIGGLSARGWLISGLAVLVAAVASYGEQYFGHDVAFRILKNLRVRVFAHLVTLAPAGLDQQESGRWLQLIGGDIEALEVFFAHTLGPLAIAVGYTLCLCAGFLIVSPVAALAVLLVALLVGAAIPLWHAARVAALTAEAAEAQRATRQYVFESSENRQLSDQLGITEARAAETQTQLAEAGRLRQAAERLQNTDRLAVLLVLTSGWALVVWLLPPDAGALALSFPLLFAPQQALARLPGALSRGLDAGRSIRALLAQTPVPHHEPLGQEAPTTASADWAIRLAHVSFTYPGAERAVLRDVSVTLKAGEVVGFVGASGSGKSTAAKLLMGWFAPDLGQLVVTEKEGASASLRRINYMPQCPVFFHETLRDNLTLSRAQPDAVIGQQLAALGLAPWLATLPAGLDTVIDPHHLPFSTGQAQRLELARALLRPSQLLILDEPTSTQDPDAMSRLLAVVRREFQGAVLIITHRPETAAQCDRLYRFGDQQVASV
ncbi:amino acid ABC transporter ATP-binding/permease protein [Lacticaseibacillus mingshuiensis]|uniref:Amino acid ABC transporter ATP-binding/permease protein n=1 Tax=Lacticaseibacillus mingshuiensis TaxID=2799574 RepID=A0ABW4CLS5_9LACO|nr:ABC transporter ATP-binding protein [Lacticaseibacillus mingshuiensis]